MKKLFCLLVALLIWGALVMLVSAEEAATVPTTCQACGTEVTWTPIPSAVPTEPGHYHYYLTKTASQSAWSVNENITVCIDLNGFGIETAGRTMLIKSGAVVNVMDSSQNQTGYIQGRRGSNNTVGGTISIAGTFNLYSGTLKFVMDDEGQKLYRAGVVYVQTDATMNVYGGVVEGGEVMENGSQIPRGATIANNGNLNLYGGQIFSGTLPEGMGYAPCVESTNGKVKLTGNAKVEDLYGPAGFLTVDGTFSGNAYVTLSETPSDGKDIGSATNTPNVTGNLFCNNDNGWLINVSGKDLKLATFTPSASWHYCDHCQNVVNWTKLNTATLKNTLGEYHMYVDDDCSHEQVSIVEGSKVCVDLYGNQWKSSDARVVILNENVQLNLIDTVGGGEMVGITGKKNPSGGLANLKNGAVFNMYGGTLRVETAYLAGAGIGTGGIAYMYSSSTFNLYGGTIHGIDLVVSESNAVSINGFGAAFYMNSSAQLNVFGGHIKEGTLGEGCVGPCVYLDSKKAQVTVSGNGQIDDVYCRYENDQVTISDNFTGKIRLSYPDTITLAENQVVGKAVNANLASAIATCNNEWTLAVSDDKLILIPKATAVIYNGETSQRFETLQDAVDAYESGYIKLIDAVSENITVSNNLLLDLNGNSITGTVTIAQNKTLYVKDSRTDDYTVSDGIYGKLTVAGDVQAQDGYLKVTKDGKVSFHKVEVVINSMTLRSSCAGIYYNSTFKGDEVVASAVKTFGVALSVQEVPNKGNIDTLCKRSTFEGFTAGQGGNPSTSTLLSNVMKTENSKLINTRNMRMNVYGRPYIQTEEGYIFGNPVTRNLSDQLTDIDGMVDGLSGSQLHSLKEFYKSYESLLSSMALPNIAREANDTTLKILAIGNSYSQDSMWILGAIYKAEKNQNVELGIAYEGGCPLNDHVKFYNDNEPCYSFNHYDPEQGKWITTKNMTLAQIINATDWDLVSMQQSSGKSGVESSYNSDIQTIQGFVKDGLGYTPTFFWNMTWSYPTDVPDDADNSWAYGYYYNNDQEYMYSLITQAVQNKIVPDSTFNWIMPTGTAVQNAKSSYLKDTDLYRDTTHLNDFGRLMAGYVWFCRMEGVPTDSFKLNYIPDALTKSYTQEGDIQLDADMLKVLEESVRNAIETPFAVTQSQYSEN